jgi:hypothetical protein
MDSLKREDVWVPSYDYQCNTGPCLIRVRRVNGVAIAIEGNVDFQDLHSARPCLKGLALSKEDSGKA